MIWDKSFDVNKDIDSDSEHYHVRDQYKVNCLTFLLFRRVICELITENLNLNVS